MNEEEILALTALRDAIAAIHGNPDLTANHECLAEWWGYFDGNNAPLVQWTIRPERYPDLPGEELSAMLAQVPEALQNLEAAGFANAINDALSGALQNMEDAPNASTLGWIAAFCYAVTWKLDRLMASHHVLTGILEAQAPPQLGREGLVFRMFGRHLANPALMPIVDRNTVRACAFINAGANLPAYPINLAPMINANGVTVAGANSLLELWNMVVGVNPNLDQRRLFDKVLFSMGRAVKAMFPGER